MSYTIYSNTITTGTTFTNPSYTLSTSSPSYSWGPDITNNISGQKTLKVDGNADISGELTVQGVKLSERLDKIEERLGILRPNEELEEKWEQLRGLRKAYMELEAEIKEKEKVWSILKK